MRCFFRTYNRKHLTQNTMKRFTLCAIALFIFAATSFGQESKPQNFKWLRNVTQQTVRDYHEGLSAYYENGKWGFINTSGIVVIQPQYDEVRDFNGGYCIVKQDGRWGIMDKAGKFVHQCTYDSISDIDSESCSGHQGCYHSSCHNHRNEFFHGQLPPF